MTNYIDFVKSVESTSWHQPNERLLHAAMGLCTEISELYEIENDQHELEEMGDVCWYLALAHDALGADWDYEGDIDLDPRGESLLEAMMLYATDLLDLIKKQIFYGKAIDMEKAKNLVRAIKTILYVGTDENEGSAYTLNEVLEANMKKLKARYPEKFTEEAAINRDVNTEYEAMSA